MNRNHQQLGCRHKSRLLIPSPIIGAILLWALVSSTFAQDPASCLAAVENGGGGNPQAITAFVDALQCQVPSNRWTGSLNVGSYRVTFAKSDRKNDLWQPDYFDQLIPACSIAHKELRSWITQPGCGATFVGIRQITPERKQRDPFLTPVGTVASVTVVITFPHAGHEAVVQLFNPRNTTSVAGDFSAPIELMLQKAPAPSATLGFFRPDARKDIVGLFMLQPYSPDKIPVVMVHGLDSLPRTFEDLYNEVNADPVIRERYQFWFFRYPTGQPVLVSAAQLRNSLNDAHQMYDPKSKNKNFNQMVIIGHSMGGMLTRTMVTESGDAYWNRFSNVPFDQMDLTPADRKLLGNVLFFHPLPYVKRVVFLSTPHRGSGLASGGSIGQLASRLVKTPGQLISHTGMVISTVSSDFSLPVRNLLKDMPNGIDNLSPSNRFVQIYQVQPIHAPYHSIIGTQGYFTARGVPITDGVVPYWSSHLEGAESEYWVPSHHSSQENPNTVPEIDRILRLNLEH